MKEIKLMQLVLKNFKGCKEFTLDLNGNNAQIFGDNEVGKTTLYDSFLWVLFGKDSQNRADFGIKTLVDGVELHNLDHEVEAHFAVNGAPFSLRKVYREKWVTKSGELEKSRQGHETDHYVDGVPVKAGEYKKAVDKLVNEEVFKLLTSPTFFNEQMKWQDRRKTLLEVVGDIDIDDVLNFNGKLKGLPTILKGRAIDDHRKITASRMSEIKKDIDMIPVQIKENQRTIDSIELVDVESINKEIAEVETKLDENASLINNIKNGSAITAKQNELRQVEMDLKDIQRELESEATEQGHKLNTKIQEEKGNIAILTRKKEDAEYQIERNTKEITSIEAKLQELKSEWFEINESEFTYEAACNCPTCGQSLPEDELNAAREKALSEFNLNKSSTLENIDKMGKENVAKKKELIEQNEKLNVTKDETQAQIVSKGETVSKLEEEVNTLRTTIKQARQNPKYTDKVKQQEEIVKEIKTLQENAQESITGIEVEIAGLRAKRSDLQAQIAQVNTARASKIRIAELEEQQKVLATEHERLKKEMYLTDQFIQSKVQLLEERINSRFTHARFNLFKRLQNGGLEEICETTYKGVPFSSGLNNAAKINIGIDIINTLTEHFGIRCPIFTDNAEAITRLAETDSQMISLIVSEPDKKLRIEVEE